MAVPRAARPHAARPIGKYLYLSDYILSSSAGKWHFFLTEKPRIAAKGARGVFDRFAAGRRSAPSA